MQPKRSFFLHPFERIAGLEALLYGVSGKFLAILIAAATQVHFHGLLHYGPAPRSEWWVYVAEHLIVWLIPAALIYAGGVIFSKSRIRIIDVLCTVSFAQLPLLLMVATFMFPPFQHMMSTMPQNPAEIMEWISQPGIMAWLSVFAAIVVIFVVWMLIWLYNAVRVSCNLKGGRLLSVYLVAVVGGDILCRLLIGWMYRA